MASSARERVIRCPKKRITHIRQLENGEIRIEEEFGVCEKQFCAAWDRKERKCLAFHVIEEDEEEDDELDG